MEKQVDEQQWLNLFEKVTRLIQVLHPGNEINIESHWDATGDTFVFPAEYLPVLKIDLVSEKNGNLLSYHLIPWQNFSAKTGDLMHDTELLTELITVTNYAIIYRSFASVKPDVQEEKSLKDFYELFKKIIRYDHNQEPVEEDNLEMPDRIQIIASDLFRNYLNVQVTIPGSTLPEAERWNQVSKSRMVRLDLVPDRGPVTTRWFAPAKRNISAEYSSVRDQLLDIFSEAIDAALKNPQNREEIFVSAKQKIGILLPTATSKKNFLYHEYESRLRDWLLLPYEEVATATVENIFPDYQPKRTPDTILDYMPELAEEYFKIPDASLENICELIKLFHIYRKQAAKHPGKWIEGNPILGAQPEEYQPTAEELLLGEIGDRINTIAKVNAHPAIMTRLAEGRIRPTRLKYQRFTFTHMDVMGSGRFFYVENLEKAEITLKY